MKNNKITFYLIASSLLMLTLALQFGCTSNGLEQKLKEIQLESSVKKEEVEQELLAMKEGAINHFYFQQLDTDKERRVYLQFVNGLRKKEDTIDIDSVNEEIYTRVYFSVANDYPEYYWLTDTMRDGIIYSDLSKPTYPEDVTFIEEQLKVKANAILNQAPSGSEYEKVKYFYETIIHETDYDLEALTNLDSSWDKQSITSVLLDKKSVCAGYSRTFQYLCKLANIECIYVGGIVKNETNEEFGHAWNLVKIGQQFYGVDTTWGDPVFEQAMGAEKISDISYDYLCVTDEILNRTRVADTDLLSYWGDDYYYQPRELSYPSCNDNSLNYYKQINAYFTSFNQETLVQTIASQVQAGKSKVLVQFSKLEDLKQVIDLAAIENNILFDALGNVDSFQYYYNEQTLTFELTNWK